MNKLMYTIPIVAVVLIGVFLAVQFTGNVPITGMMSGGGAIHEGVACVQIIKADGAVEDLGCTHNEFTNEGKVFIATHINGSDTNAVNEIHVGNGTTAEPGDASLTVLPDLILECGLEPNSVTFVEHTTGTGNLTASTIFTSSCSSHVVNTTGLNCTSCGAAFDFFAGNDFSASATLENSDQLNVTWYVWSA